MGRPEDRLPPAHRPPGNAGRAGISLGWPHLNAFILQFADNDERDMPASALSTVQMFAVAFGTALARLVANLTGFEAVGDKAAVANSALWLFVLFSAVAALAAIARRALISLLARSPT